jgi:hypothetical protein
MKNIPIGVMVVLGAGVLLSANAGAQTNGFVQIPDSYTVQKPWNLPLSDRFSASNGVYTCWVYGTDQPFQEGNTTGPRTEMRWETWTNQTVANQFAFDEMFSAGTQNTCVHQIKSDDKGDGSGGEAVYLQVNQPGTLRESVNPNFASGIAGTWYHINSIYDPSSGNAELYYNGSLVFSTTGFTWPNGNWYFKTGVYDNGMPTNAEAWVQIKNVVHWLQSFTGTNEVQNEASGLVLNNQGSLTNGSAITQWTETSSPNLDWTFIPMTNGYYQINSVKSGLDAVVKGASTANGAGIIQWSFGSSGDDQWKPILNSDGSYTLYNLHSGLVLEDPGSSTNKTTQMDQYTSNGGANQKWKLISQ